MCLTCDRADPEAAIERECARPDKELRRLVQACGGDWDRAKRALRAARGNLARAIVAADRTAR